MFARFSKWMHRWALAPLYAMGLSDNIRTTHVTDVRTVLDSQAQAGRLLICKGTRPAKAGAIGNAGADLLSTLVFNKPSLTINAGSGLGTVIVSPGISDTNAAAGGTATWGRLTDGGGNFVADLLVTATGAGGDVTIDNTSITAGGTVNLTGGTFTAGNA